MSDPGHPITAALRELADQAAPPRIRVDDAWRAGRRRRRAATIIAAAAVAVVLAAVVPAANALRGGPPSQPTRPLAAKMTGLPMPAGTNFQFLVNAGNGAAWYSTATRRAEHISGLPRSQGGYRFSAVYGGWTAVSTQLAESCPDNGPNACAGRPQEFYFIADGSLAATRIGAGFARDGVVASNRPGAVWLVTYPRASAKLTGSATVQLVSTTGRPLGPRHQLPADHGPYIGVGSYLLLSSGQNNNLSVLWDPRTGRVLGHFDNAIAAGPDQIASSRSCQGCRVQILNVSTGKTVTTPIPGRDSASLNAAFSDDGRFLAVQAPGREIQVYDTATRTLTAIPGTALSSAEWQNFGWRPGGHRLVITAGPNNTPGPAQLAYWQPGNAVLRVATIRNLQEITDLQIGQPG
jgi:hypothetical protein